MNLEILIDHYLLKLESGFEMKKVNIDDLLEKFLEFEKVNNLFSEEFLGIKFWHLIRFNVFQLIQEQYFKIGLSHSNLKGSSIIKRLFLRLFQFKFFIFNNPLIYFAKKDMIILNHHRRVKDGEKYTCIYTDLLLENINYSSIIIEEPMNEKHYRPIKNSPILYTDYINFIVSIKKIFVKTKKSKYDNKTIISLYKKISKSFMVNFAFEKFYDIVYDAVINFKYRLKYYRKILKRVKPKIIIEVVSYSTTRYVINYLSKELNIPTVEIQHGTMGKYHVAYNFKDFISLDTFPDYILTFGSYWNENTRFPIQKQKVLSVGWPYLENKVNYYKSISKKVSNFITILFISQGTIGHDLSKTAVELTNLLDHNYKVIYKLHPGEYDRWMVEYPWLINKNIQVIDNNIHDMHYFFSQSNIQVGVSSTALFEGIMYDITTYILRFQDYEYFNDFFMYPKIKLVNNHLDLYNSIHEEEYINKIDFDQSFKRILWEQNGLKKMIKEINKIINYDSYE